MFSQYPSNDRWWCRLGFPADDGQPLYKTASIVIGPLHSLPLILKNHRLHLVGEPYTLKIPWNDTLIAVSDCSLLNEQSRNVAKWKNSVCQKFKNIIFKSIINKHWIRFLYDSKNHHARGLCYLPNPKPEVNNTKQYLDNSCYRKMNPTIVLLCLHLSACKERS